MKVLYIYYLQSEVTTCHRRGAFTLRSLFSSLSLFPQTVTKTVQPNEIAGIGFDATCSLVVLDEEGTPISVSHDKNDDRNVIMW